MNWNNINFDWNHARAFLATAKMGSLTAAAKALNQSQPTLSRQVNALEQSLGVILFEKNNKKFTITPAGEALLLFVNDMAEAANKLKLTAAGQSSSLEGNVCISTAEPMAVYILPPILKKLRQLEPGISIELIVEDSITNLGSREADIALRFVRPTEDDLIAKKVSNIHAKLYATPEYLSSIGNLHSPEQFNNSHFLGIEYEQVVDFLNDKGFKLKHGGFPVRTSNLVAHWELVKQGVGIGFMLFDIGDKEPAVKQVLENTSPLEGELWLVTHRELRFSQRIKRVYEFLAEELDAIKYRF